MQWSRAFSLMCEMAVTLNFRDYKIRFLFTTIQPSDDFQRTIKLKGHGLWYVCKSAPNISGMFEDNKVMLKVFGCWVKVGK